MKNMNKKTKEHYFIFILILEFILRIVYSIIRMFSGEEKKDLKNDINDLEI